MSRSAEAIRDEWLIDLLPSGAAWPKRHDSNLAGFLMARATTRAALEADIEALNLEISPGTSTLLLNDYHAVLGPDPAGRDAGDLTTTALQALLQQRWTARGDQRISAYVAMGALYGVALTVWEPEPALCGVAICGADVSSQLTDRFVWVVTIPAPNEALQTLVRLNAPADTRVVFFYSGLAAGQIYIRASALLDRQGNYIVGRSPVASEASS